METFIGKGAVCIFILVASCFASPVRDYPERIIDPDNLPDTVQAIEPTPEVIKANIRKVISKQDQRDSIFRVLKTSAERWLSVRELTGNNDHPMITVAMKLCGLDGDKGYAWCAACQAEIFHVAEIKAPKSARVVDWFNDATVWSTKHGKLPDGLENVEGMVGGLYYNNLGRLGHVFLIVGEDKNNFYTYEGNTNVAGSREGDGFYKKVRAKASVAAIADYIIIQDYE